MCVQAGSTAKRLGQTAQGCGASWLPWEGVAKDNNQTGLCRFPGFISRAPREGQFPLAIKSLHARVHLYSERLGVALATDRQLHGIHSRKRK